MNWRKFRRSPSEIFFRLRQEALNFRYLYSAPSGPGLPASPLPFLPPAPHFQDARFATLAGQILDGKIPLLGFTLDASHPMPWRKDSRLGLESGLEYFRRIPYLDPSRVGDHKVVWELNRHQHLVLLAQHHLLSGDPRCLDAIETQLLDWIERNPFHRGINWASALEVAFRALSWVWIYHLVGNRISPHLRHQMGQSLYRHGLHLSANLSHYFSPNTHLLGEAVALHALGLLFDVPDWRRQGGAVVDAQLTAQVLEDGAHFEQSTYYHVYAIDFFVFHALLAGKVSAYAPVLLGMGRYLDALLGVSRVLPLIGDDDGGRLFHPYGRHVCYGRATLSTLGLLYEQPDWIDPQAIGEQAAWWLPESRIPDPPPPVPGNTPAFELFPHTGKASLNAGPLTLLLDSAPFGPYQAGHSHAGCLALILGFDGEEILIDPGTFVYVGDPDRRDWFRSIAAHNTVSVEGFAPAAFNGPFGWLGRPETSITQTGPASFLLTARYSGLDHRRIVTVLPERMEVEDLLDGPPGQARFLLSWQCGVSINPLQEGVWSLGRSVQIRLPGASIKPSFRSTAYGSIEPGQALQLSCTQEFPARFVTRFEWGPKPPRTLSKEPAY